MDRPAPSYERVARMIMHSPQYLIIINDVTGLRICCTIPFIVILEHTCSTYFLKLCCNTVCQVMPAAASDILCLLRLLMASFSFVLELTLRCVIQACSLRVEGCATQPRCVEGCTI